MIVRLQTTMVEWLIEHNVIEESDRGLYEYAMSALIFSFIAPLLLCVVFGSLMGVCGKSFIVVLPFLCLRKFSGGYHTKRAWTCLVLSSIILAVCFYLVAHVKCGVVLDAVCMASAVSLCICSPVDCENRRLGGAEKRSYKITTVFLTYIFAALYLILRLCRIDTYAVCIAMGIILSAGLQLPCILRILKTE